MKQPTINLLPPSIKKNQRYSRLIGQVMMACLAVLAVSLIWSGGVFLALKNLEQNNQEKLTELETLKGSIKSQQSIEKQVMLINERTAILQEAKKYPDWQLVLDEIAKFTPPEIKLSNIQLSTEADRLVTMVGAGETRRVIIEYQLALENSPIFRDVEITALGSATSQSKAISFSINLKQETKSEEKK